MQLSYPKNVKKPNLEAGDLSGFYVIFCPQIIEPVKPAKIKGYFESIIKGDKKSTLGENILNMDQDHFAERLTKKIDVDGRIDSLYIALPTKPLVITTAHNWSMGEAAQGNIGAIMAKRNIAATAAKGAATGVAGAVGIDEELRKTLINQSGLAVYEPKRQYFESDDPIALNFEWTMVPENEEEASEIKKIIKSFQFFSTTQSPDDQSKGAKFFQRTPAVWEIDFGNDKKFKDMLVKDNKFPHMVCTQVEIGMGGESEFWSSFEDEFPTQIKLTLEFQQYFSIASAQGLYGNVIDDVLLG